MPYQNARHHRCKMNNVYWAKNRCHARATIKESPMPQITFIFQTARNNRCPKPHHWELLMPKPYTARNHRSKTKSKANSHLALSPHCLPGHKNRCRARATKTRTARNSQCRKPMPTLGQNRVVSKLAVKTER